MRGQEFPLQIFQHRSNTWCISVIPFTVASSCTLYILQLINITLLVPITITNWETDQTVWQREVWTRNVAASSADKTKVAWNTKIYKGFHPPLLIVRNWEVLTKWWSFYRTVMFVHLSPRWKRWYMNYSYLRPDWLISVGVISCTVVT